MKRKKRKKDMSKARKKEAERRRKRKKHHRQEVSSNSSSASSGSNSSDEDDLDEQIHSRARGRLGYTSPHDLLASLASLRARLHPDCFCHQVLLDAEEAVMLGMLRYVLCGWKHTF